MGEMAEHIKFCDSSHSKHPDLADVKGWVAQEKNIHQTGLKDRQTLSIHAHTHTCIRTLVFCCYHGDQHSNYSWVVILRKMNCRKLGWDTSGYTLRRERFKIGEIMKIRCNDIQWQKANKKLEKRDL
jgi:hypothetical protein